MKKVFLIFLIVFLCANIQTSLSQFDPECYQTQECLEANFSPWVTRTIDVDNIGIPELGDCEYFIDFSWRYCTTDPTICQIFINEVGISRIYPYPHECIDRFLNYIGSNNELIPEKCRKVFDASHRKISAFLLSWIPYIDPNVDYQCNNQLQVTRYFPGDCVQYCAGRQSTADPYKLLEIACVQEYCCGIVKIYCINGTEPVEMYSYTFGEGSQDCIILQPGQTFCPVYSEWNSQCEHSCIYVEE